MPLRAYGKGEMAAFSRSETNPTEAGTITIFSMDEYR
jgi:hypothetical protein